MAKEREGRRDGLRIEAVNPRDGKRCEVLISHARMQAVATRSMGHAKECVYIVPEILQSPTSAFEGLRRPDDLVIDLAVIDGHKVVDPFGIERVRPCQELDAIAVWIVRRCGLEILTRAGQFHDPRSKIRIRNGAHNSRVLKRASWSI